MNIYVETNFVLELTLMQEEAEHCEAILSLCRDGRAKLIIPAYCFAEPNEALIRRESSRDELARKVDGELNQLARSLLYKTETATLRSFVSLLTRSGVEQRQRFAYIRERLLNTAEVISLDKQVLIAAPVYEHRHDLTPQDSLVLASVLQHLRTDSTTPACFITRNSKDFNDPDIKDVLLGFGCKLLFNFSDGYGYIQSQL